jgi:predicted transposase/invertase (TIGR01784 family)
MRKAEKLLSAITDRRRKMRQKQSKENSRRYHQKNEPAVKREAERLSTPTNTMEKNEKASLESRITSGMSMPYSVSEKESDRELEDRFERYREILKDLTLMSDSFMRAVLKNPKCTEEVLRIILNKDQLKVIDQRLQADYKNLQGRSSILDCVAVDSDHNLYNVEIQQKREGASPKRARYHSGLLDMNFLEPGEVYQKLPTSYVIFITETDALGYHLPIYHISRKIRENGKDFPDSAHIIYVDSKNQEDTELGRLMHDFHCKSPEEMYHSVLQKQVFRLKRTREGVNFMCREMDKIYRDGERVGEKIGQERGEKIGQERGEKIGQERGEKIGRERGEKIGQKRGKKQGIRNEQRRIVNSLKRKGKTMDEIAYLTGIHETVVKKLLGEGRYATK